MGSENPRTCRIHTFHGNGIWYVSQVLSQFICRNYSNIHAIKQPSTLTSIYSQFVWKIDALENQDSWFRHPFFFQVWNVYCLFLYPQVSPMIRILRFSSSIGHSNGWRVFSQTQHTPRPNNLMNASSKPCWCGSPPRWGIGWVQDNQFRRGWGKLGTVKPVLVLFKGTKE